MDVVAIDWSGDATESGQRRHIWIAVARDGQLGFLESGHTRPQVIDQLIAIARARTDVIVGFDFAFSFPAWFLQQRHLERVQDLWQLVATEGEQWLKDCQPPFWGRPGSTKPALPDYFRATDRLCQPVGGIAPKSVFQIGGPGAVGTGSIRGMPYLQQLHDAGFNIWPFDPPRFPVIVEIYPRSLTGAVNKSDPQARRSYLTRWHLPPALLRRAEESEDAFDAAISALVMSRNLDDLDDLDNLDNLLAPAPDDPITAIEGQIWLPPATPPPGVDPPGRGNLALSPPRQPGGSTSR